MSEHKQFIMLTGETPYAAGERAREEGATPRRFDWDKAKKIVEEKKLQNADYGFEENWFWTAEPLVENGIMVTQEEEEPPLGSRWATPVIKWEDGEVLCTVECWKWVEPSESEK